jgi:uncharacterized protein
MGKIAIWILVAVAVMLLLRLIGTGKRRGGGDRPEPGSGASSRSATKDDVEPRGKAGELMMSCAVCGIHLPSSDAVFARGKVFCGPEHRDLEEARQDGGEG